MQAHRFMPGLIRQIPGLFHARLPPVRSRYCEETSALLHLRQSLCTVALPSILVISAPVLADEPGSADSASKSEVGGTPTAASEEAREPAFSLPRIAVTGRKIEAPPSMIVREVTVQDIDARNAQTVGDALIFVPGVNVQIGGSSGDARAWIRGYRDRDVLVLFDGIPISSGFEGTVDLNEIAVQRVASINVMKSAPSVIYGTNGVGGVIDIVPAEGATSFFLDALLEPGSDDRMLARAGGGNGNGNVSFTLSAQHQRAADYSLSRDYAPEQNQPSGERANSDFERSSVFFHLDAQESPFGITSLFVNLADAEKGLPVETGVEDPDYQRLTTSRRQTVGLSNHFDKVPLSLKLYYNGYDSVLTSYSDAGYSLVEDEEVAEDYSFGGKLYSRLETSANNTLVLAAGAQTDVFNGEGELEQGSKAELTTWTLAVEDEFWINQTLSLAAGGIFSYFDQTRLGRSTSEFNPQVALAWQISRGLSLHAAAAQRTRFPKLRELYRRRYGNPELEPQTSENYEAGFTYQYNNGWAIDLSLFHSEIDGLIERTDRRSLYMNLDRVSISGLETAIRGRLGDALFTRLAYTYVDAAETLPDGGSRQLRSRPQHTVMAEVRWLLPRGVSLFASGIYVSGLHDLDPDDAYVELPAYLVVNLKAAWAVTDRYEAYLALANVDDEDYFQRLGDPREGRSIMFGLKFTY